MCDKLRETRGLGAQQILPHLGVHSVRADDDIGIHFQAVFKDEADRIA